VFYTGFYRPGLHNIVSTFVARETIGVLTILSIHENKSIFPIGTEHLL